MSQPPPLPLPHFSLNPPFESQPQNWLMWVVCVTAEISWTCAFEPTATMLRAVSTVVSDPGASGPAFRNRANMGGHARTWRAPWPCPPAGRFFALSSFTVGCSGRVRGPHGHLRSRPSPWLAGVECGARGPARRSGGHRRWFGGPGAGVRRHVGAAGVRMGPQGPLLHL